MHLSGVNNVAKEIGIIGAGPSGLGLGLFLKKSFEILEKNNHVGGHAASFAEKGFTFDYGPHILFSRDQSVLQFIISTLGVNVNKCKRHNKIAFKDRMINYPFENDLKSLALEDNYACIRDFLINPYKEKYHFPSNMREWFLKTFGEGICSRYLFPYNEKIWNIPVEQLSMGLADRIPNPPAEDILKSSLGYHTEGYLHQLYYHYPKKGGYQAISEAWKMHITMPICYEFNVDRIAWTKDNTITVRSTNGETKTYHRIVSTMPIHEIIKKIDCHIPADIKVAVDKLIVNPMLIISFGVRGIDANQYTAVYFPEKEFWVNRISYPCTFSAENGPENHWSLQAEITCSKNAEIWNKTDAEILNHTKVGLQKRNLLPADDDIVLTRVDRKDYSYVVYDVGYEDNVTKIRSWFKNKGIYLLGRFSYFEYINIDMALNRAIESAIELNQDKGCIETLKRTYLASHWSETCVT